jgi:hypothetical protein
VVWWCYGMRRRGRVQPGGGSSGGTPTLSPSTSSSVPKKQEGEPSVVLSSHSRTLNLKSWAQRAVGKCEPLQHHSTVVETIINHERILKYTSLLSKKEGYIEGKVVLFRRRKYWRTDLLFSALENYHEELVEVEESIGGQHVYCAGAVFPRSHIHS